jgi:DNA replication protein DnaC
VDSIKNKIQQLGKALGRKHVPDDYTDYASLRTEYEALANRDINQLQKDGKKQRIQDIQGRSDLNSKWTFDNLIEDSQDVIEAVSYAKSFIAAHEDMSWRRSGAHMMIFYGDYGRGKSHTAGAIAHELIEKYEISVLYRQLSSILDMRLFSYDFSAQDNAGQKYREINQELLDVDLLILDEVCVNETVLKKNAQSWLGNVLRQRLANHKNCILITNHNLAELENAIGRYCFESIKEYDTYKVKFSGPSRRKEIIPAQPEPQSNPQTRTTTGYQPNQVK